MAVLRTYPDIGTYYHSQVRILAMVGKRPRVEPIRQPNLFEMEKLGQAADLTSQLKIDRPYSLPGILLGTTAFTAAGWEGSFYPTGTRQSGPSRTQRPKSVFSDNSAANHHREQATKRVKQ
jgi:hypothetical protein